MKKIWEWLAVLFLINTILIVTIPLIPSLAFLMCPQYIGLALSEALALGVGIQKIRSGPPDYKKGVTA